MAIENFVFVPLKADTEIKPFKCEDKDLSGFLVDDAKKYMEELMAVTYLIESRERDKTIAYFSLLNDKISYDPQNRSIWNKLNRMISNPKRRKHYPAIKIGRLAVSQDYRHIGLGWDIINMIKYISTHDNRSGCRFVTVDAYPNAVEFYKKCGFSHFSGDGRNGDTVSLYFDLKRFVRGYKYINSPLE